MRLSFITHESSPPNTDKCGRSLPFSLNKTKALHTFDILPLFIFSINIEIGCTRFFSILNRADIIFSLCAKSRTVKRIRLDYKRLKRFSDDYLIHYAICVAIKTLPKAEKYIFNCLQILNFRLARHWCSEFEVLFLVFSCLVSRELFVYKCKK